MEITQKELSNIIGITAKTVQTLTTDGLLNKQSSGKYDLNSNVQAYCKYREKILTQKTDDQKRLTKLKADQLEIELSQLRSETISTNDAMTAWSKVIMTIRNRLLSIPKKTAPLLVNHTAAEIEDKIKKSIFEALTELSEIDLKELAETINDKDRKRKKKHSAR